jgi:hypothetical protein
MIAHGIALPRFRLFAQPNVNSPHPDFHEHWFFFLLVVLGVLLLTHTEAFAGGIKIPGTDASDKLEAAGTLLRIVDSMLFSWGARIFAGLCVMSAGWNLKEQRFGIAVLCVVAALVLGTAPTWVRNIFDIGGGGGLFSRANIQQEFIHA